MKGRLSAPLVACILAAVLVIGYLCFRLRGGATKTVAASTPSSLPGIACLGRLEPEEGVRHLAAPFSMQGPSILSELLVREGEQVASNQVLAGTAN